MNFAGRVAAIAIAALLFFTVPALAEVCDKVSPYWDPASGPMTVQRELLSWGLLGVVSVLMLIVVLRRRRLIWILSAILIGWGILGILPIENEIYDMAVQEGCVSGVPAGSFLLVVLGLAAIAASFIVGARKAIS